MGCEHEACQYCEEPSTVISILVGSFFALPLQADASSTTSFVAELLVSVVDFTQMEGEENWTEVFAPPVPTQRSVTFLGLSFFLPLQISHTGDVIVSGQQSYMCVVRYGGYTNMRNMRLI